MRVVYIAHPLGAGPDRETNRAKASRWVAWAADQGVAPVADWVILSGQWTEDRRTEGLAIDCALIGRCDELWLVGGRISPGMQIEAAWARNVVRFDAASGRVIPEGVWVRDFAGFGSEPPSEKMINRLDMENDRLVRLELGAADGERTVDAACRVINDQVRPDVPWDDMPLAIKRTRYTAEGVLFPDTWPFERRIDQAAEIALGKRKMRAGRERP
jgi:hypothetical protein